MTAHGARLTIQARARAVGIDGASGHSLRVGTAQDLTAAGYGLAELQNAGHWQSPDMPGDKPLGEGLSSASENPPGIEGRAQWIIHRAEKHDPERRQCGK